MQGNPSPDTNLQSSNQNYCKNHPTVISKYFVSDQPWIRYCQTCALNVALCGRKIQKQFTPEEFDRKMAISAVVFDMKRYLERVQENTGYYTKLTNMLEQAVKPLSERIKQVQTAMKELSQAKEWLQKIYFEEVVNLMNHYFQTQSKINIDSMSIKRELENIESNFGNLIEMEDPFGFQVEKVKWSHLISNCKKQMMNQYEYEQSKNKVIESMETFYDSFQWISQFTFKTQFSNRLFKRVMTDDQLEMVLTPIEANSLNNSLIQQNMLHKPKSQLRLRSNRKQADGNKTTSFSKATTKRNYASKEN